MKIIEWVEDNVMEKWVGEKKKKRDVNVYVYWKEMSKRKRKDKLICIFIEKKLIEKEHIIIIS